MLAYNEEGEVYYIVDIDNYEKMKYLGYDKANNALRYTRYNTGKKYTEYHWKLIIEYLLQQQGTVKSSRRNIK